MLRLPAPGLRGTWARAYALLTRLVSQIGWDELLKTRSSVFVMEEEYRMQKAHTDMRTHTSPSSSPTVPQTGGANGESKESSPASHENGTPPQRDSSVSEGATLVSRSDAVADDDASTRGVVSPAHSQVGSVSNATDVDPDSLGVANGLPTIRISTESDTEREKAELIAQEMAANGDAEVTQNGIKEAAGDSLERPVQAAAGASDGSQDGDAPIPATQEPFSFSNKRLCERWLDNLFMVLYEVSMAFWRWVGCLGLSITALIGPTGVDHIPCRSSPFQDAARCVSQDGPGMGDSRGPWWATTS